MYCFVYICYMTVTVWFKGSKLFMFMSIKISGDKTKQCLAKKTDSNVGFLCSTK